MKLLGKMLGVLVEFDAGDCQTHEEKGVAAPKPLARLVLFTGLTFRVELGTSLG
jgi:hypothetical protein